MPPPAVRRKGRRENPASRCRWRWFRCLPALAALAVVMTLPTVADAQQRDVDPSDRLLCGGWSANVAKANVQANNAQLDNYAVQMLRPRERPDGRWQVWKEECARLDLERDVYALWRVMAIMAGGAFMVAVTYAGLIHMTNGFGQQSNSTSARSLVINAVFGLVIVSLGLLIWQGALTEIFGISNFEIGHFNPIGVTGR